MGKIADFGLQIADLKEQYREILICGSGFPAAILLLLRFLRSTSNRSLLTTGCEMCNAQCELVTSK